MVKFVCNIHSPLNGVVATGEGKDIAVAATNAISNIPDGEEVTTWEFVKVYPVPKVWDHEPMTDKQWVSCITRLVDVGQ